ADANLLAPRPGGKGAVLHRHHSIGSVPARAVLREVATMRPPRAVSSVGRAPARQAGGHWFEPSTAHLRRNCASVRAPTVGPACTVGVARPPRSSDHRGIYRKVVTVLFCDVVGSTALGESVDPEALQGLLAGYFERMKEIVESHEGSVEKFIGDAVMAVFGVPQAHED